MAPRYLWRFNYFHAAAACGFAISTNSSDNVNAVAIISPLARSTGAF